MKKRRYLNNENYISKVVGGNLATMPNDILCMIDDLMSNNGIIKFDKVRDEIIQAYECEDKSVMLEACISNIEKIMKTVNRVHRGCDCTRCGEFERNICFVNCFRDRYADED